jgi:putative tryptophan/tyrosine transport system substrate-binding protein
MRRRDFITLVGTAAVTWPHTTSAQQPERMRRIGVLMNSTPIEPEQKVRVGAFEQGLRTVGWKLGHNLIIEYRWSGLIPERMTAMAEELVGLASEVIVANTTAALVAARNTTKIIPIVFTTVSDPVTQGFVKSFAQPGGNITGFVAFEFSIGSKWVGLLKQLVPSLSRVALMFNPTTSPQAGFFLKSVQDASPKLGIEVTPLPIHAEGEIEPAITNFGRQSASGLIIGGDNFLAKNAKIVVEAAAKCRLPAVYANAEFLETGGLMTYTFDNLEAFRGAAFYVDRILKGAEPGVLPIQFPTKYKLIVSVKAAKAIGIELPMSMMLTADEVIE